MSQVCPKAKSLQEHHHDREEVTHLKVIFTGMIGFKKELELPLRDSAEVYDGTDITSRIRGIPCIDLYPCN
jgi:hypothetical protein